MKQTIINCDICGKNITYENKKYKIVKQCKNRQSTKFPKIYKMDICEKCNNSLHFYISHTTEFERIFDKIRHLGCVEGDVFSISNDDLKKLEEELKREKE